jgi:hypothetical protein
MYRNASLIKRYEKLSWANLMLKYEGMAEVEMEWQTSAHCRSPDLRPYPYSAMVACMLSWEFSALEGAREPFVPTRKAISARSSASKQKRATFTSDTVEHCWDSARVDAEFCRASEYYRPGQYACTSTAGYADTSFKKCRPKDFWDKQSGGDKATEGENSDSDSDDSDSEDSGEDTPDEDDADDEPSPDEVKEWENILMGEVDGEDLSDVDVDEYILVSPSSSHRRSREESPTVDDENEMKRRRF